ncbi:TM0106 family RecB-like putative nuclease [Patescibacteria group bacterium]|nr:TM0106 family RecB-like putative nuclease [Patescibacteria group bacterium]
MLKKDYLTASDYYKFLQCPHWPYYDRFASDEERKLKRVLTEPEEKRMEDGLLHEKRVVEHIFEGDVREVTMSGDMESDFAVTLELMKKGVEFIYQGVLVDGDWAGRPDILKKVEGESEFGKWQYIPVDVKSAHIIQKYHRLQLMFYAVLLERIQGTFPSQGMIINKDSIEHVVDLGNDITEFKTITEELEKIRVGEKPDPVLRKSCFDVGVWGALCEHDARVSHDIAQLYNVDIKKLKALRGLGIRTIEDAAEMDVTDLDGRAKGLRAHGLHVAKMQAQSLIKRQVIVRGVEDLEEPEMEIHFDIESDPPNDTDYLLGFLIRTKEKTEYKSFVARRLEDEGRMWADFLEWISTLDGRYHVVHYASYERVRLDVLERRYGKTPHLDIFRERMVDLKTIVTSTVIFPEYFYGLKYLAKFLGYRWRGEVQGGGQSVDVFEKYIETADESMMDQILIYNEDDVRATAVLADWYRAYAKKVTTYDEPYPWVNGIESIYAE